MYAPLRDLSADLLIPNLHLIPEDTISLLETNRDFIEGYMVGLNHEMARRLRFNEFPTDLRPSSFRQFWDVADIVERDPSADACPDRGVPPRHRSPAHLGAGLRARAATRAVPCRPASPTRVGWCW